MESVTFTPYRYSKAGQVMRHATPGDGYKRRADRLAEACGLRWVHRARGYVGTATQCDRVARLMAAGWDARVILFKDQDFSVGDVASLPEPWMRRRPGLWVAPQAPAPVPDAAAETLPAVGAAVRVCSGGKVRAGTVTSTGDTKDGRPIIDYRDEYGCARWCWPEQASQPAKPPRATISQAQTAAAVARVAAVVRDAVARGGAFKARAHGALLYAREGEDQAAAVARLKAATKRRHKAPDPRNFPTYSPGMSTAQYVAAYECANYRVRHLVGETPDGRQQGDFWAPLNTAPAALYEGGALDFEPVAEPVPATAATAPAPAAQAPAPQLPRRPRGHYSQWLRSPCQEWRVWCRLREAAPMAHLAGTSGASLRRASAGLLALHELAGVVDRAAPWRHLVPATAAAATGPPLRP